MAYQALYRKWRPLVFDDVVGQQHITRTLKNEIVTGKVAHAYLFTGIRGTGKTSTAKIFSRAVNCLDNHDGNPCNKCEICRGILDGSILDVIEIDAASNNSVDDIREIREEVVYTAARTRYKVYIIDEVHMLSMGAFNALLKTLEEPPAHIVFILATTEVHKLPATILSRCQRFDFRRITGDDIADRLAEIAKADGISVDSEGIRLIAGLAEGSMRDALSILDRCVALGADKITRDDIINVLGVADSEVIRSIASCAADGKTQEALEALDGAVRQGKSPVQLCDGLIKYFRDLLVCKVSSAPETVLDAPAARLAELKAQAGRFTYERLVRGVQLFSGVYSSAKYVSNPRISLELAIIKLCSPIMDKTPEGLMDRLSTLEKAVKSGEIKVSAPSKPSGNVKKNTRKLVKGPLTQVWPRLLEELKEKGHLKLFAFLKNGKPSEENGVLNILFDGDNNGCIDFIDNEENKKIIAETIKELTGKSARIKFEAVQAGIDQEDDAGLEELKNNMPGIEISQD